MQVCRSLRSTSLHIALLCARARVCVCGKTTALHCYRYTSTAARPSAAHCSYADITGTARLPELPAAVHFDDVELGGERMFVAALSSGPFFLGQKQYVTLKSFVDGPLMPHVPKLVVFVGPIKSGKSALLFDVLPGLIAAQYAAVGGPTPVIFRFTFALALPPAQAAMSLLREASRFAATLGFSIGNPVDPEDALFSLGRFMGRFALGIANRGASLSCF